MSNLVEVKKRIVKTIQLSLEDRRHYFIMACLSELDLSYDVYKELIFVLLESEKLVTCIDFYLTNSKFD